MLLGLSLLCRAPITTGTDFNHDAYAPRKLAEVAADMQIDPRAQIYIDVALPKISTDVVFTGNHRRTAENVVRLIDAWVRALRLPTEYASMFSFEVEMRQDGEVYWMPIQNQLLQGFVDDVRPGTSITLRAMLIGAENHVPVFVINAFVTH